MWDARGNKRYFYRHVRIAGRPRRQYAGAGRAAELAAAAEDLRRLEQRIEASERHAEQACLQEAEAPLLLLCEVTDVLARAALLAAGFHRHDRGAWRRTRGPKTTD
jgi:hypothetical protein